MTTIELNKLRNKLEIKEIENEIGYYQFKKSLFLKRYYKWINSGMPFWLRSLAVELSDYKNIVNKIKRLSITKFMKQGGTQIGYTPQQIEQARNREISEFYGEGKKRTVCPFHQSDNKQPDFAIYGNSAYCFSGKCNWQGDTVKFVMDFNNLKFPEAIKYLLK